MRAMEIRRATLETCAQAEGTVVVINVLRAFTTAAYAFEAGVRQIILVADVADAFALKRELPHVRLVGEQRGLPVEGFDFANSPTEFAGRDLTGAVLVQRTTAGTQGVVRSVAAERVLVTGLCNASATVRYLQQLDTSDVTLLETGVVDAQDGLEDRACADFIEALLVGTPVVSAEIVERVRRAPASRKFLDARLPVFPLADLEHAVRLDAFGFAMEVSKVSGRAHLRRVEAS